MGTGLLGVAGALGLGPWQLGASAASARSVGARPLAAARARSRVGSWVLAVAWAPLPTCSTMSGDFPRSQARPVTFVTPKSSKTRLAMPPNSRSLTQPVWKRA